MDIVILDGFTVNPGHLSWEGLYEFGTVRVYDYPPVDGEAEIINRIGNSEIVITNNTPITQSILEQCPSIQFISELGTGYNNIDVTAAAQKGIPVSNIPDYGTYTVAQYTIGLLLELCHYSTDRSHSVHNGRWLTGEKSCYWDYTIYELCGKTLGVIGYGKIGRKVAEIARALGMRVVTYTRTAPAEHSCSSKVVSLNELLECSDVISLHCPLTDETREILGADALTHMKDGVKIINTSRGGLINDLALAHALQSGKVSAAALDVISTEPISEDNPLLSAPNCIITPHVAWTSDEARQRVIDATVKNVKSYLSGAPINVVNDMIR